MMRTIKEWAEVSFVLALMCVVVGLVFWIVYSKGWEDSTFQRIRIDNEQRIPDPKRVQYRGVLVCPICKGYLVQQGPGGGCWCSKCGEIQSRDAWFRKEEVP